METPGGYATYELGRGVLRIDGEKVGVVPGAVRTVILSYWHRTGRSVRTWKGIVLLPVEVATAAVRLSRVSYYRASTTRSPYGKSA